MPRFDGKIFIITILMLAVALVVSACNLTSAPQESLDVTNVPTTTLLPSRTPIGGNAITVTPLPVVTGGQSGGQRPTSVVALPPTAIPFPTSTQMPVSIVILSPIPGNIVAGNVQVLGAAIHPQFLQYQLEFGPDPNPSNLWYPASSIVQTPVLNGLLGIWQTNTGASPDGIYQLRLRLYLRDGTSLATIVNSIRIQNQQPTPVPTATTVTVPRPIAAFTQDRATGQAPLVVRFTNQSTGSISQHNWDFGDGSTATDVNPSHTFRTPGIYTVRLRVRGPGGTSNVSREINVQSPTAPVAAFIQDVTTGPSPLTVKFTNQSTGSITAQEWNFGDGEKSNDASPTHIFQAVGTYNVILTVTGPGGSTSVTRQITVQNPSVPAPLAGLVASTTEGNAPLTVQFDASDSSGQIDTYNWDFGDGQTGNGQVVTHTYTTPGSYPASLTVVGPGGQAKASVTINVTQQPDAPTAAITTNSTSGNVPLTIEFNGSTSSGQIDTYFWDFGDGQTGNGAVISHTFTTAATYTVQLTVTGAGGSHTTTVDVNATDPIAAPVAAFDGQPNTGTAALDVQFTNLTTGDVSSFAWDFSDGGSSTDRDPLHRFEAAGNYVVILTATGPGGQSTAEMTISVSPPVVVEPPVAAFSADPTSGTVPLTVQFNATAADNITSYDWNFGDNVGVANGSSVGYTFNAAGDFVVTLTVTGVDGQQASQQMTINVSDAPLTVPEENVAEQIPILPDFDQPDVQPRLRGIYENGLGQGKRATIFAIIGDDLARQSGYLTPFADPGLDVSSAGFQEIVDWYRQADVGDGRNSFSRPSVATGAGWHAQDILDPAKSDSNVCSGGETPLDCEMRLLQPFVAIVSVGYNDVLSNTDPNAFQGTMEQIIQSLLSKGIIPVVTTIQPIPGMEAQTNAINNAIIQAARNVEASNGTTVLIYNLWLRLTQLPGNGLGGDNAPSVAPAGAGDLSDNAVSNFGMNARNRNTLRILSELRSRVFPDATP